MSKRKKSKFVVNMHASEVLLPYYYNIVTTLTEPHI